MQCPICGFENMPEQNSCTRCRAKLKLPEPVSPRELTPPRAGCLRCFRPAAYWFNRAADCLPAKMPEGFARIFRGDTELPGDSLAAMYFSICPGLGHLLAGRRRAAALAFGVWLLAVVLAANFYYGIAGSLLAGLIVSWHAGVVFDAGRVGQFAADVRTRLRIILWVLVIAAAAYFMLNRLLHHYLDLVALPYQVAELGLKEGDILLVRRFPRQAAVTLERGDMAAATRQESDSYVGIGTGMYVDFRLEGLMMVRILAIPGDKVEVSRKGIRVNGALLARDMLPAGNIPLPETPVSFTVGENQVLGVSPVRLVANVANVDLAEFIWNRLYRLPKASLYGRAVAVYLPLGRRRFLDRVSEP